MSMRDVIQTDLTNILKRSSWWSRHLGSQFVAYLVLFISQAIERARAYADRSLQESFLTKATNRASILAGAEDVSYVGLKISPSTGKANIANKGSKRLNMQAMAQCISSQQVRYSILDTVTLDAGMTAEYNVAQIEVKTQTYNVTDDQDWFSILLDSSLTVQIHKIIVRVNGEQWVDAFKFRGCTPDSKAYMEFYKATDQLGIRFANGIAARKPVEGDVIELELWLTKGDTTLLDGQKLELIDTDSFRVSSVEAEIKTTTSVIGGLEGEDIESIRNGALYTTVYDDQISWDSDYITFIKNNVAGVTWLNVWGEGAQEKLTGQKDLRNINKIFICAYSSSKSDEKLHEEILALFEGKEGYNENYESVARKDLPYTLTLTGSLIGGKSIEDAELAINEMLTKQFGKDSARNEQVYHNEIWRAIEAMATELEIRHFEVVCEGLIDDIPIDSYHYLDVENSTVEFTY